MPPPEIRLAHCRFVITQDGCCTIFDDETAVYATPEDTDSYRELANMLGYGADTLRMCREHEFLHSLIAGLCWNRPSPALWDKAHGETTDRGFEEHTVLEMQRRLNELRAASDAE